MITDWTTREYFAQRRPQKPAWPENDPPPEVTSRDPRPADAPRLPRAAVWLIGDASGGGWTATRAGYSRGPERAVRVGTYKITEAYGLSVPAHPLTGWRWMAVYARTVGAGSWKWRSIAIWHRDGRRVAPGLGSRFAHATIADLKEFCGVGGSVTPAWFKAVHARGEEK